MGKILKWIGIGFVVLIVIGVIGGMAISNISRPTKVENAIKPTEQPQQQKTQTFKMGDTVDLEGKTVTVNGVAPYTSKNQFLVPKSGNKFISIDVTLANNSKEAFNYNVLDFRFQDDKDYTYNNAGSDQEPYLTTGAVQPGEKVRGFITYEIPVENTPAKFIFTPGFLSTSQIIIKLTQ